MGLRGEFRGRDFFWGGVNFGDILVIELVNSRLMIGWLPCSCQLIGRIPKWSKGTDCKFVSRGFESHSGLYYLK